MASVWLCTASFRILFQSELDICFSNRKKLKASYMFPEKPDNIKSTFSPQVFIASCLIAVSYSMKLLLRAIPMNKFKAFLCITVSRGNTPSNARVMQFGVLSGRPCNRLRYFLWNFSRFSISFFMRDKVSSSYMTLSTTKVDHK